MSVAEHVRIFEPDPSDDLVEKRTEAIKDLRAEFGKIRDIKALVSLGNSLATGCAA